MARPSVGNIERFTFVYPKSAEELFRYIAALGGSQELPGVFSEAIVLF
jgi:hypothetical protein